MITDWDVYPDQQRFLGLLGYLMHRQDSARVVKLLSCVDEHWFVDKDLKHLFQAFFIQAMQMDEPNKRVSLTGVLAAAEKASGATKTRCGCHVRGVKQGSETSHLSQIRTRINKRRRYCREDE